MRNRFSCKILVFGIASVALGTGYAPADERPNIVLIFCDDLGYADIGSFGAQGYTTPNLDRLAHEGRKFTDFYVASPVCSASRAALLTGCYPSRVSIYGALAPRSPVGLNPKETTMAEMLRERGYVTGIVGKWHLGDAPNLLPTQQGFDEWFGLPYSNDMWPYHPTAKKGSYPPLPLFENDRIVDADVTPDDQAKLPERYAKRAVNFIRRNADRPFFLYFASNMPHVPLYAGEQFRGTTKRGLYGDVICEIDWTVGQILAALDETGVADQTLVIFTSDNGPWLAYGDHSGIALPLREGKGTCWDGGVRVPCLMRWPGKIPANTSCDSMLMTIDLLPTLAELVSADLPDRKLDGQNIWPLLVGEPNAENPHEAYAFWYLQNELQAVVSGDGRWKLQLPHRYQTLGGRPGGNGGMPANYEQATIEEAELYDLQNDISETTNVAAAHPNVVAALTEFADSMRRELGDTLSRTTGQDQRAAGKASR